jgi:SAM-dependent methyltransferase
MSAPPDPSAAAGAPNALASNATFEFTALNEAENYRTALVREFAPRLRGCVVEVGAGIGQITTLVRKIGAVDRVLAVEPEASFAEELRRTQRGLEVVEGTAEVLDPRLRLDALVSANVLEHIEDDAGELRMYHQLLAPQRGWLCLLVPACPELYSPLDRDFGHFRRYTCAELRNKLSRAGFRIEKLHYYNLAGYFGWWWMFRVLKRRGFNARTVRFFDRCIFPMGHFLETRICRPPIGQSLIATAQAG